MHPGPKHSEMPHTWLPTIPGFIGSFFFQTLCRGSVEDVHCRIHCFSPKQSRNSLALHHASGHFNHHLVSTLYHTILLRCIWCSSVVLDAMFIAEKDKLV